MWRAREPVPAPTPALTPEWEEGSKASSGRSMSRGAPCRSRCSDSCPSSAASRAAAAGLFTGGRDDGRVSRALRPPGALPAEAMNAYRSFWMRDGCRCASGPDALAPAAPALMRSGGAYTGGCIRSMARRSTCAAGARASEEERRCGSAARRPCAREDCEPDVDAGAAGAAGRRSVCACCLAGKAEGSAAADADAEMLREMWGTSGATRGSTCVEKTVWLLAIRAACVGSNCALAEWAPAATPFPERFSAAKAKGRLLGSLSGIAPGGRCIRCA